jgi:hypothetical protein
MLNVLGYLINSIILIIIVTLVIRIYMNIKKEEPEKIFLGPLVKEVSDLILKNSVKFFPVKDESALLYTTLSAAVILFILVKAILIK